MGLLDGFSSLFGGSSSNERDAKKYAQKAEEQMNKATGMGERMLNGNLSTQSQLMGIYNPIIDSMMAQLYGKQYLANGDMSGGLMNDLNLATQAYLDQLNGNRTTEEQKQSDKMTQTAIDRLTGKTKTSEQQSADDWADAFLSQLGSAADTVYNQSVANLQKSAAAQRQAVSNEMQRRGIGGSGIALDKIAGNVGQTYEGMNQAQGNKVLNQLNNTQTATQFAQNRANNQMQNYLTGLNLATNQANSKLNNYAKAFDVANNRVGGTMGYLNNGVSGLAGAGQYANGAYGQLIGQYNGNAQNFSNTANAYSEAAAADASAAGNIFGSALGLLF